MRADFGPMIPRIQRDNKTVEVQNYHGNKKKVEVVAGSKKINLILKRNSLIDDKRRDSRHAVIKQFQPQKRGQDISRKSPKKTKHVGAEACCV